MGDDLLPALPPPNVRSGIGDWCGDQERESGCFVEGSDVTLCRTGSLVV